MYNMCVYTYSITGNGIGVYLSESDHNKSWYQIAAKRKIFFSYLRNKLLPVMHLAYYSYK